ncbi:TIGR00341 family protein [Belliella kenyensis]|uniref:TIGR00341 family protein n=1 Tax=Belliella kenyensis TaxID=1472724 RepID=A0ABV8EK73_9BACT|nr:TIGR00341 family protein [Belliella kenyensis]MCH7403443.1 TIGR00341 family protein [Belliella kenyensis]MDN3602343.1 TIGR00341 family protein [Belliella kenyensis]
MKSIILIYDESQLEFFENSVLPLFSNNVKMKLPYKEYRKHDFSESDFIVTYLSDEQIRSLLDVIIEDHWKIGFLPHPKMLEARQGFGVSSNLEVAVENILTTEEVFDIDVLTANGQPVLNKLMIGDSFSLLYAVEKEKNWFIQFATRFKRLLGSFRRVRLQPYAINWSTESGEFREKPIDTAALGMVVVQHGQSSILSRRIIEGSYANDGLMHCLILAPSSIWEILKFGFFSLFNSSKKNGLPEYVAHIKTDKVKVVSREAINYTVDDVLLTSKSIELEVLPRSLAIVPGKSLKTEKKVEKSKAFKVQNLPQGELKNELLERFLPITNHATTEEFKWLFSILRENSKLSSSYMVLMALSTIIATFGLFGDSSPVIIGAMILAPLMSPIISLAMGVLRQDEKLIKESFKTIGFGLAIGYLFAVLITWFTPLNVMNSEITARIRPNLLDLGVAAASGVAGAYAHAKKEIAKTLAGVAIAVALVPPLAVSGVGLGWGDWSVFWGALLLLGTNLAGMVLAAAMTFLFLGFSPFKLAKKGLIISLVFVGVISAPLAFGFSKMVKENKIIQELSGKELSIGTLRDVKVIKVAPLKLSATIVSESPLDVNELGKVKEDIEEVLSQEIELELSVAIEL